MRALWLNEFDFSGNVEAVINWARGVKQRGLEIHLVLQGVPPELIGVYENFLNKQGLKGTLNINRQQIQNLLYYRDLHFLHVFHPGLFSLGRELSSSFRIPWLASIFNGDFNKFNFLHTASYITCSNSLSYQAVKEHFYPYNKQELCLIPQGVTIKPVVSPTPAALSILYIGPLKNSHLAAFQAFNRVTQGLKSLSPGIITVHDPLLPSIKYHPWPADIGNIAASYQVIAGFGYYLLQGIASGKITLILEEEYGGIFSPFQRLKVPDFRAKAQAENDSGTWERLQQDILFLAKHWSEAVKLQQENWNYARENHDLEIVAEKIIRLYANI